MYNWSFLCVFPLYESWLRPHVTSLTTNQRSENHKRGDLLTKSGQISILLLLMIFCDVYWFSYNLSRGGSCYVKVDITCFNGLSFLVFLTNVFYKTIGVFPKWTRNSVNSANSGNLISHWTMNWAQFKDLFYYLCLADAVVATCSFTQEVACSNLFNG